MSSPARLYLATTTVAHESDANRLADGVIAAQVAACAQVEGPIRSSYRWQGNVHTDPEWRITFKIPAETLEACAAWVQENHPYDVPQWMVVAAESVGDAYLAWAQASVKS